MKKIFYLASIAALAFSSCAKDETTSAVIDSVRGGSKIMAKAEGDATRTHLEAVNGNYEFRWSENDVIGVYGSDATSAKNVPFALLDSYADEAEGIFESNYKLLAGDNFFAYYPQVPGNDYAPEWKEATGSGATAVAAHWNLEPFKMKISKDQNYKPGSFNTVTAPAVSTAFTMDEDGNADVTMQPVGDYLFVNLAGTEDIQNVTLELWSATRTADTVTETGVWSYVGSDEDIAAEFEEIAARFINQPANSPYNYFRTWAPGYPHRTDVKDWEYTIVETRTPNYTNFSAVNIAGEGTLKEYTYVDANKNASTRYYLSNEGMTSNKITLAAGQLTDVVCHDPNVYVFVVPGGLLGTNPLATGSSDQELVAKVYVNKEGNNNYRPIEGQNYFVFGDESLNGGYALKADGVTPDTTKPIWRQKTVNNGKMIVSGIKWENTVFWANKKVAGVREAALYNPENDFIIYNEVDFLQYMNEYGKNNDVARRNAYVCAEHQFNFSDENMRALAAQIAKTQNSDNKNNLRRYIDDYVANGVPCVAAYTSKFKGNGAVFTALKDLQSAKGLFGNIGATAVINDITFEDIIVPEDKTVEIPVLDENDNPIYDSSTGEPLVTYAQGVVLGTPDAAAKFVKVGVTGADAHSILAAGSVAQYEGLVLADVEDLDQIICTLNMEKDLTFKNWDVASTVAENVFGEINAETGKDNDKHHVVTIAAGDADEYAKLAADITIYRDSAQAVSVVIEGVSYWTGSTVNTSALPSATATVNPIAYAEQLAYGKSAGMGPYNGKTYAALTRNMDANYENIEITWPNEVDYSGVVFSGAEFAVKGIVLNTSGKNTVDALAPFKFTNVSDLTLDGVELNILTSNTKHVAVPKMVAGLSIKAANVSNVVINDLKIETFEVSNTLNHDAYYGDIVPTIGWLVAEADNLQIEDSSADVAYSSLEGRAGLVGEVTITDTDSFFENCSVSYGDLNDQEAIADFAKVAMEGNKITGNKYKNVYGTMVAHVINNDNKAHGIKFYGCGNPVFLYTIGDNAAINVYYDNNTVVLNK